MANLDIKQSIKESGFPFWRVAEQYGCADTTFSRKLRHELPLAEKEKIRTIIKELSSELPSTGKIQGNGYGTSKEGA